MLGGPYPAKLHAGVVEAIIIKTPVLATNKSREGGRGGERQTMHTHTHTHWTDFPRDRKTDSARRRGKRQAREGG